MPISPMPLPADPPPVVGDIEAQCRRDLAALKFHGPMAQTLAATALRLARELDDGAKNGLAMVARELRETIKAIAEGSEDDDDTKKLHAGLSSPVLDTED